jgi:phosphoglucosamine mutase
LRKFPQLTSGITVRAKKPIESLPNLPGVMKALEAELGASGRILVRYSGTEPKLRFLIEAPTDEIVRAGMDRLLAAARADLDVV